MIPPACTSVLQPLDTAIKKPFKEMLSRATELTAELEGEDPEEKWTVSRRRIMTTHAVAAAARELASRPLSRLTTAGTGGERVQLY
ncbi:hypothetical protein E4U58_001763 [Claviceps cyperi]|nr:hypothetical protein E4U58_001763 [Claviceps cyperi]